jgi:serine protease
VIVAVVDTGLDRAHEDIVGRIWRNDGEIPGNGVDDDGYGYVDDVEGYDFINDDGDPSDGHGHGTHVAGTIAATGNNGVGIVGVAPSALIMPLKGLSDTGRGNSEALAKAIIYAADNGARVINNSWGGSGRSKLTADAVAYAHQKGVVVLAAAGNYSKNAESYSPAGLPQVITVAASDHRDAAASFSNWGPKIDITAPGVEILSLLAEGSTSGENSDKVVGTKYRRMSGTSMACPHAAGVAALLLAKHPNLTPEQVRYILRNSADDVGEKGWDIYAGHGRLDAQRAVAFDPQQVPDLFATIKSPIESGYVPSGTPISGTAAGRDVSRWELALAEGKTDERVYVTIKSGTGAVNDGDLGALEMADQSAIESGFYYLRLRVFDSANRYQDSLSSRSCRPGDQTRLAANPERRSGQAFNGRR